MTDASPTTPRIQTARLFLGSVEAGDATTLFAYRSDPRVARYQGWQPTTLAEAEAFIARGGGAPFGTPGRWSSLAVRALGSAELIGDVGVHFLPRDADPTVPGQVEIGFTIAPAHQRRGYAAEAVTAVLAHLFEERGVHRVIASVDPRNEASMALLARLGFEQEAHFRQSLWCQGEWVDDVIFAILRTEGGERSRA